MAYDRDCIDMLDFVVNDVILILCGFKNGLSPDCNILDVFSLKGLYWSTMDSSRLNIGDNGWVPVAVGQV